MAMRVGWILKAGDFDCGSNQLSAALRLLLLVLFLQKQEKYIEYHSIDIPPKPGYTISRKVGMDMQLDWCRLNGKTGHEAGRALLASLYRRETGADLPEIRVTDRGKPYFPEGKYHFSISHTKNHAFCILAEYNVGLDAEERNRKVHLKLAEKMVASNG
jgi:4'-phosphopantetheinyl transferase EntD